MPTPGRVLDVVKHIAALAAGGPARPADRARPCAADQLVRRALFDHHFMPQAWASCVVVVRLVPIKATGRMAHQPVVGGEHPPPRERVTLRVTYRTRERLVGRHPGRRPHFCWVSVQPRVARGKRALKFETDRCEGGWRCNRDLRQSRHLRPSPRRRRRPLSTRSSTHAAGETSCCSNAACHTPQSSALRRSRSMITSRSCPLIARASS